MRKVESGFDVTATLCIAKGLERLAEVANVIVVDLDDYGLQDLENSGYLELRVNGGVLELKGNRRELGWPLHDIADAIKASGYINPSHGLYVL
jgi:hypothetical protein